MRGEITLEVVLQQLDTRVQHLLYRSHAVQPFSPGQLQALLTQSRTYNETHGITGLLCYHDSHFVQLLEGEAEQVHRLYAAIQQDARHEQVTTLRDGAGPLRFFPDWCMAYVAVEASKFEWVLSCVGGNSYPAKAPPMPVQDPHLLTLLAAFGDPTRSS